MKKNINQFSYAMNDKVTSKGYFKVYQARSGRIILMMGNGYIELTIKQVEDLGISVYELEDYSQDDYLKAYNIIQN